MLTVAGVEDADGGSVQRLEALAVDCMEWKHQCVDEVFYEIIRD